MKKFISALVALVMLNCLFSIAIADGGKTNAITSGDYQYELLSDGGVSILKYKGGSEQITIPDEIDGKPVTSIGDRAFSYCKTLTSITIPKGITQIGENPFVGCKSLITIAVSPENTTFAVKDGVLFDQKNNCLICYPVTLSEKTYSIPDGTKTIGASAFLACHSLTSIEIPDSVEIIGKSAFSECKGLTSIIIPDSVTIIEYGAFGSCSCLAYIEFSKNLKSIGGYAFSFCTSFTNIVLPDGLEDLGDLAFSSCENMTSIFVPASVSSMGETVFKFDAKLTVQTPENSYATKYCKSKGYRVETADTGIQMEPPVTEPPKNIESYDENDSTRARTKYESDQFLIQFPKTFYKYGEESYYGIDKEYIDEGKLIIHPNAIELNDSEYYQITYDLAQKANSDEKTLLSMQIYSINERPVFIYLYKYKNADWIYASACVYNNGNALVITYVDASKNISSTKAAFIEILNGVEYKDPAQMLSTPILFRNIPWGSSLTEVKEILKEYNVSGSSGKGMRTWTVEDYTEGDFAGKYYKAENINIHANGSFSKKVEVAGYEASFEMSFAFMPIDGHLTHEESDSALFAARYTINPADVKSAENDLINKLSSLYGTGTNGKSQSEILGGTTTKTIWNVGGEMKVVLMATDYKDGSLGKDEITISYVWTRGNMLLDNAYEAETNAAKTQEKKNYNNSNTDGL